MRQLQEAAIEAGRLSNFAADWLPIKPSKRVRIGIATNNIIQVEEFISRVYKIIQSGSTATMSTQSRVILS